MPGQSLTQSELNDFLTTNETKATRAMNDLFSQPNTVRAYPQWITLNKSDGLLDLLLHDAVIRNMMGNEADSMAQWPPDQLEDLRQRLVKTVLADKQVIFYSYLYNGPKETIAFQSSDGNLVVQFISPQGNLQESNGKYSVLVNPH